MTEEECPVSLAELWVDKEHEEHWRPLAEACVGVRKLTLKGTWRHTMETHEAGVAGEGEWREEGRRSGAGKREGGGEGGLRRRERREADFNTQHSTLKTSIVLGTVLDLL